MEGSSLYSIVYTGSRYMSLANVLLKSDLANLIRFEIHTAMPTMRL